MEEITTAALLGMALVNSPAGVQLTIPLSGDMDRKVVVYSCEGTENPFPVEYINAAPNFLAIVPVGGERLIMASTLAADGTRYAGASFEWWVHGADASFSDLRQQPTQPVSCSEKNEAP